MTTTNKKYVTIKLHIDQEIPEDEVDEVVDRYVDVLARAGGDLTWEYCDWDVSDSKS